MRHRLINRALVIFGFSPAKALEILLGAERQEQWARRVVILAVAHYRIVGRKVWPFAE